MVQAVILPNLLISEFGSFIGVVGVAEILLFGFPFALGPAVFEQNRSSGLPLKKGLVTWSFISLILAGLCIVEGALGYGVIRALWSYVYILPARACLYLAAKLRKW